MTCPNINSDEWKALTAEHGEDMAYLLYYRNNSNIPSLKVADKIIKNTPDIRNKFIFEGIELNAAQKNELFSSLKYYFVASLVNNLDNSQDYSNLLDDVIGPGVFEAVYEKALLNVANSVSNDDIGLALAQDYANNNIVEEFNLNIDEEEFKIDPEEGAHRNMVYREFKTYMSNVLNFKEIEQDDDKDTQNNNTKDQVKDSWIKESIEQNRKDSFSRGIKLLLSGVPKLNDSKNLNSFNSFDINKTENSLGLITAMDQSEINNLLTNIFANVTPTLENFISIIMDNKEKHPSLAWLYNKVFNDLDIDTDEKGNIVAVKLKDNNISSLPKINLMIKFIQSFSNNQYNLITFVVQPDEKGNYIIKPQDADSNNIQRKILTEWRSGLLNKIATEKDFVKELKEIINDTDNPDYFKKFIDAIEFPLANYDLIDPNSTASQKTIQFKSGNETFIGILSNFIDAVEKKLKTKNFDFEQIFDPKADKNLYILAYGLIEHNSPYRQDYDGQLFNSDGNLVSKNNLHSYQTLLLTRVKNIISNIRKNNPKKSDVQLEKLILDKLQEEAPEVLNLWSSDSIFLQRLINGENITLQLIDGMKSVFRNETNSTGSMVEGDLWSTFINCNLHNILTPVKHSDRSSFLGIKMPYGSTDILGDFENYYSTTEWENKFKTYLYSYLRTELKRIKLIRTTKTGIPLMDKQGVDFVLFDGLFDKSENSKKIINKILEQNLDTYNLENDVNVNRAINKWVDDYLKTSVNKALQAQINFDGKGAGIDPQIAKEYFSRITDSKNDYNLLIKIAAAKHFISAVEQSKLFFGDPALYSAKAKDGILIYDMIKRLNMQSSTKQISVVDNTTNTFLNSILKSNDFKITIDGETFKYKKDFNGDINELIINDPEAISGIANELRMLFGENSSEYQAFIKGFEETDGYSMGNIFFAIETLFRTEGINPGRLELAKKELKSLTATDEELYDLYTVPEGMSANDYINNELRPFTQQKFQYVGPNYQMSREDYILNGLENGWENRIGIVGGRKTSYGFLMPSMIRGTVLEQLNNFMLQNGIDVIHFSSASKFGGSTPRDFYNTIKTEDGEFTIGFNTLAIEDNERGVLDFRYMGKQQEISYEIKDKVVDATQARKNENAGIMFNGELPIDFNGSLEEWNSLPYDVKREQSNLFNLLEQKDEAIGDYVEKLTDSLFNEYNIDNSNNITSPIEFVNLIKDAAVERGTPDNIIDAIIDWLNDDYNLKPIESLPNYQKVQYILTSIVTNNLLILKRNGTMLPQAPSTGWENASRQVLNGKFGSANYLKYYQIKFDEQDNPIEVQPAECAMPLNPKDIDRLFKQYPQSNRSINKLIDILNAELDAKFKSGNLDDVPMIKALRIPHQQLSSTDVLRVRRWLNPIYNQTILVPGEFIVKNGSDYDIDKLTIYMPNLDEFGDPVKYETEKENLFDKWFYNTIGNEVIKSDENYAALSEELIDIKEDLIINKWKVEEDFNKFYEFVESLTGLKTNKLKDAFNVLNKAKKEKLDDAIKLNEYLGNVYRDSLDKAYQAKTYIENFTELADRRTALFADVKYIQETINNILTYNNQAKIKRKDVITQKNELKDLLSTSKENIKQAYRDEFNKLSIANLNSRKAHENRILDIELQLLLNPARAKRFLSPVIEGSFKEIAKTKQKANLNIANKPGVNMFQFNALIDAVLNFTGGKKGVGIIATWITFQNLAERYNIRLNNTAKLNIPGTNNNITDGYIQLANTMTTDMTEQVENIYSALMTSQVDIVKDDYAAFVNICLSTLNTVCYLVTRGTPTQSIINLIDSDIVKDFLKIKNAKRALSMNAYPSLTSNKKIVKYLAGKYSKNDLTNLTNYITASDQAKAVGKVKDLISADTKYLKSPSEVDDVTINLYEEVMSDGGIIPQEDVEKLLNESLLAPFVNNRKLISDVFGKLYVTRSNETVKRKLNQIKLNLFSHIGITIEKNKAIQKFDENLINYLIQTESDKFKNRFNELFTGIDSLPNQIQRVKDNEDYENNPIIKNLIPILSKKIGTNIEREQVIDNLKMFLSRLTTGESNSLIEAFQELKSIDEELYNDLVIFNIFQSGISNGTYQYAKVIPYLAQKNVLEALVNLNPKSITDAKLADFTVKFMLSNSFNQKLNKKNISKYIDKLKKEELSDEVSDILADVGGVENEMFEEFDNYNDVNSENGIDDIVDDIVDDLNEKFNPFKIFETFKYNGKVKLVNTKTEDIVNPIGGYDGMDYTQNISNFKDLVNDIKNQITILGNKPASVAVLDIIKQAKLTETTQPSTSVVERTDKIVLRSELKANPTTLYLFGDNDIRRGLGGQAKEMRGEPNAVGVSTKKLPARSEEAYKSDTELEKNKKIITNDINKAIAEWNTRKYNKLIIPQMGVGLAELPTRAPETYKFLQQELKRLEDQVTQPSVSIEYNYNTSNVSEQTREDYKQYVLEQLGKPEIKAKANAFDFIYPDLTITIFKDGSVSYTNVNQKIVDLSKTDSGYDLKFMVGLNKLAEESTKLSTGVSTEADTFYNLKEFSDEEKFAILDNIILKKTATTEDDAINQLNDMLISDREFAIEFMKSCLT